MRSNISYARDAAFVFHQANGTARSIAIASPERDAAPGARPTMTTTSPPITHLLPASTTIVQHSAHDAAWPHGTVTFLFTDIEGSTRLWEQYPQAMPEALVCHDAILRQAVVTHGGVVFKTVGDAVCAAFASAPAAVTAALVAQRALQAEAWGARGLPPGQPLRVRMALHTGATEMRSGDYLGPPLNRVARLLAAAHGGQILLSQATAELVHEGLPAGVTMRDLGVYQLRDLRRPERIFQLISPDLPADFPPLTTLARRPASRAEPACSLLNTKVYIPPAPPNLVARPRLTARLSAGIRGKLTLISAPAGFGKTTLVSAWLHAQREARSTQDAVVSAAAHPSPFLPHPAPVAWVSLDESDNDPGTFLRYLVTALQTIVPTVGATTLALLQSPQPPPRESLLTLLLNDLAALPQDSILVLDDYQVLQATPIHQAVTFLLDHLPPHMHLVIATRSDPPLPLARLRARGELTELRAADLRFTPVEAGQFLTEIMELPLLADDIAALEERTEGWITGLQLAALAMCNHTDRTGFIAAFTGSHRFVMDYLAEEVFVRQPPHIQAFLLHTSILDRMCGPLCEVVIEDWELGGGNQDAAPEAPSPTSDRQSQAILEYLERTNLFLIALDDERQWYRYHHLFAEVLHQRLLNGATHETVATLYRRASAWCEQQGLITEAVQYALAGADWEHAAELLEQHGLLMMVTGQVQMVRGWLESFPDPFLRARPLLAIHHALALMFSGDYAAVEGSLRYAERCVGPEMPEDLARVVMGGIAIARANNLYFLGDHACALSTLHQGLEIMPETGTSAASAIFVAIGRTVAALFAATAYKITGDVGAASESLAASVIAPVQATGNLAATLHSYIYLAYLRVLQGRLRAATATYAEVANLVPGPGNLESLVGGPSYYFGLGDILREWNDLDAAERYLSRGMHLVAGTLAADGHVVMLGHLALARLQHAAGNSAAALDTLDQFIQLARERNYAHLLIERVAAAQAQLRLAQGDVAAAVGWADASQLHHEDAVDFPREPLYLTLARVRIAQGRVGEILPLLDRLLPAAEACARMSSVIEILALRGLALQAQGQLPAALAALERALALAEPEGYIRTFVDEGAPMAALIREAQARGIAPDYVRKLLGAFPDERRTRMGAELAESPPPSLILGPWSRMELLTTRELEVLRLIAAGASNREIAAQLVITVGTVKRHINNLFSKLDVRSRTQAIRAARTLNLLEDETSYPDSEVTRR